MDEKIRRAEELLTKGYKAVYSRPVVNNPTLHRATLILTSPEGEEERIEFEGMEVSAADMIFYDYLEVE